MAFATTNVVRRNNGSTNGVTGTWTSTVGDEAGTMTIGGHVLDAEFIDNASSGPYQQRVPTSASFSNGTTTLTVYQQGTVTDGKFSVQFK